MILTTDNAAHEKYNNETPAGSFDPGLLRAVDTLLIDYDGTLMDTNDLVLSSWRYAVRELTGRDVPISELKQTFGEVLAESMERIMPEIPVETAIETYRSYQRGRYLDEVRPYEGAAGALAVLKARGYKLGIPTSRMRRSVMQGLEHFGLIGYIDAIVTADEVTRHKPDPESLLLVLDALGSRPERALMIGDSKQDMEAARNAGCFCALVDWSAPLPPEKRAAATRPDFILRSWGELPGLLGAPQP